MKTRSADSISFLVPRSKKGAGDRAFSVAAPRQINEPQCATYDHPDSGCTGRCWPSSSCPNRKYVEGKCPNQADDIKCCLTVDTDMDCAVKPGNCMPTAQCPNNNYQPFYCPTKPNEVKCCFEKPTDTCSGRDYVPYDCLHCICMIESNCRQLNPICRWDVNSESCGPYQIKEVYYIDAKPYAEGVLGGDYHSCTSVFHCSEQAVHAYMKRYATSSRLGHAPTCEDFARIHNGGPNGHLNDGTLQYWNKVKTCLDNL
ncbi:uncharacterized protein [Amphiura filiformis]|uniref:uncharacterized protein n=1 Tax=Amphiura filiformis TaxID=82378 RepID=UPI003B22078D